MPFTLIVFASFYPAARHAVHYADAVAQALHGRLVLLHVNRVSMFDPYDFIAAGYQQQELARQADTGAALSQLAAGLHSPTTVEIATDLLPTLAQDMAAWHRPALFVLSQPDPAYSATASLARACAELLRAGNYPLLVLPPATPAGQAPRRILLAVDREPFVLGPEAEFLRALCALPGTEVVVAHVSSGVEDDEGCALALRAVQASGLLAGLPPPELRGYEHADYGAGLLAAVADTQADLVVVLARQRSYWGGLFHRSVTGQLLTHSPVPVLVLPVAVTATAPTAPLPDRVAHWTHWTNTVLTGLAPAA